MFRDSQTVEIQKHIFIEENFNDCLYAQSSKLNTFPKYVVQLYRYICIYITKHKSTLHLVLFIIYIFYDSIFFLYINNRSGGKCSFL